MEVSCLALGEATAITHATVYLNLTLYESIFMDPSSVNINNSNAFHVPFYFIALHDGLESIGDYLLELCC